MQMDGENYKERIEELVKKLGAEESIKDVELPPAPAVPPPAGVRVPWWLHVAAAAMLAVGVGIGWFIAPRKAEVREVVREKGEGTNKDAEIQRIRDEYSGRITDLQRRHERELEEAEKTHSRDLNEIRAKLAVVDKRVEKLQADVASRDGRITSLEGDLKSSNELLKKQNDAWKKDIALLQEQKKSMRELEGRMAMMKQRVDDANLAAGRLRTDLKAMRERLADTQKRTAALYIGASAPSQRGLDALRAASRHNRLVQRCGLLRGRARDVEVLSLLDRVEASLVRLDMLDVADLDAVRAFSEKLRKEGLVAKMDQMADSVVTGSELDAFLIEAAIVLRGVEHVG
jgi:hypothetical protein